LIISVRDDCVGLAEGWDPLTSGGIGLANTRERLLRLYDQDQHFDVRNAPGGGALATVEIPFHTETS
jgi:sensor histidine kinase YesM